ncbi:phosphatase PAP2 family protein [Vibrio methylphosphonaticus]|uniref:phosphatase PAP2 family protein n=1 Tax=Vibrio methylphosphonaticus TaxID=2946866 RepID=UPI00202A655E|nr:phosphatase PAP2 family protein [Vibrio methylphosphonaticus]MCL9773895.1 phosphatase PAP2 family protein [Vibrio methylphosphonaticus]
MTLTKDTKISGMLCLAVFATVTFALTLLFYPLPLLGNVEAITGQAMQTLTYSAGHQGFLITLLVFSITTAWVIKKSPIKRHLLIQLGLLLVLSFGAKSLLKNVTESPRPYTHLLAEQHVIKTPSDFYTLNLTEKDHAIDQVSEQVSHWRTIHWMGETDYSFPSGHTIFASICVLFFGGLLLSNGRYFLATLTIIWASSVAMSRLWLGMHRPIDLFGSMLFGLLLYAVVPMTYPFLEKWLKKAKERVKV